MSLEEIKRQLTKGQFEFTGHAKRNMVRDFIDEDQIYATLIKGVLRKSEPDEYDAVRTKYTLIRRQIMVVVKDTVPPLIITVRDIERERYRRRRR